MLLCTIPPHFRHFRLPIPGKNLLLTLILLLRQIACVAEEGWTAVYVGESIGAGVEESIGAGVEELIGAGAVELNGAVAGAVAGESIAAAAEVWEGAGAGHSIVALADSLIAEWVVLDVLSGSFQRVAFSAERTCCLNCHCPVLR